MPAPLRIDPVQDALLVIDLQPDFMPGGPLAVAGGDEIVTPIAALLPRFATVVATQDWHPRGHVSFASSHPGSRPFEAITLYGAPQTLWPDHCVQGTEGAALHPALPSEPLTLVLRKGQRTDADSYSAFRDALGRPLRLTLRMRADGIKRVFIGGLALDYCVGFTALDASKMGFETFVVEDATRSVDPKSEAAMRERLADAGVKFVHSGDFVLGTVKETKIAGGITVFSQE